MAEQLVLPFRFSDALTFENYRAGPNRETVRVLRAVAGGRDSAMPYLWGPSGSGKSHLLQAVCGAASAAGRQPAYLPLSEFRAISPALLEGLERLDVVCIDDIDAVAGDAAWERALFDLYNRLREAGVPAVMAGAASPADQPYALPDLASRITWGGAWQLKMLDDGDKRLALQGRAGERGLDMPDDVAGFLMSRMPRDMPGLFALLDRLDAASLEAKRKLTIPFVKSCLDL